MELPTRSLGPTKPITDIYMVLLLSASILGHHTMQLVPIRDLTILNGSPFGYSYVVGAIAIVYTAFKYLKARRSPVSVLDFVLLTLSSNLL